MPQVNFFFQFVAEIVCESCPQSSGFLIDVKVQPVAGKAIRLGQNLFGEALIHLFCGQLLHVHWTEEIFFAWPVTNV